MSRCIWLSAALAVAVCSSSVLADPATDGATEARLRALEKRVSELEQQARQSPSAELERRVSALEKKASPTAATPASNTLEQRVSTLEQKTTAPPVAAVAVKPVPVAPAHATWSAMRVGMTWSQVKQALGVPGKVKAGVFGDVMYFPDESGGHVEFDRDGRVSAWSETPDE